MNYQSELNFTKKLCLKFHLDVRILTDPMDSPWSLVGQSLRSLLDPNINYPKIFQTVSEMCGPNRIYKIRDPFQCSYFLFQLPDTQEPSYFLIGPYRNSFLSPEEFLTQIHAAGAPPALHIRLQRLYEELPLITDDGPLMAVLYTLGEVIWGGRIILPSRTCRTSP